MIPFEIAPRMLELPGADEPTIVIATGDAPRHHRFALRLQQEFGTRVLAWYEFTGPPKPPAARRGLMQQARAVAKRLLRPAPAPPPGSIFLGEVAELRRHAVVEPRRITRADVLGEAFLRDLKTLKPFFFLTLGGPLYGPPVLGAIRGAAINQHAGFSPDYKGNQTVYQALYHRDLACVAATVHLTTSGADAGPILRRSNPCLTPGDSPFTVIERVVALGTELMIESVREIAANGRILAFDQPLRGVTYLARDCDAHVRNAVKSDFDRGWLGEALARRKSW